MLRYMRNRSGVVFPYQEGLINDVSLGFEECDVDGVVDEPTSEPESAVAPAKQTRCSKVSLDDVANLNNDAG